MKKLNQKTKSNVNLLIKDIKRFISYKIKNIKEQKVILFKLVIKK
jgi:hypothetical protein